MCSTISIFVYNDVRGDDNKDPFFGEGLGECDCQTGSYLVLRLTRLEYDANY